MDSNNGNTTNDWRHEIPLELDYNRDIVARENLFYGTAWKGDNTDTLVLRAIEAGFRNIATARQPLHYREDLVATGVRRAIERKLVTRDDVFVQTTFSPLHCQDPLNLPDEAPPVDATDCEASHCAASIRASNDLFEPSSQSGIRYLDAVLLHALYDSMTTNREVWDVMTGALSSRQCRQLGVSNVTLESLEECLCFFKPTIVQNSFHRYNNFDADVRALCRREGIVYQAYGVLKQNKDMLLDGDTVGVVASQLSVKPVAALYGLIMVALGPEGEAGNLKDDIKVLVGTQDAERMRSDIQGVNNVMVALKDAILWKMVQDKRGVKLEDGDERRLLKAMRSFRNALGHAW